MVELKPFKNIHYDVDKVGDIGQVVTLPYDIISEEKQKQYYQQSEYNFIRLVLRCDEEGDSPNVKYEKAAKLMDEWIKHGILVEEEDDSLYIYDIEYDLQGVRVRQSGIVGLVKIEPFEEGKILPHEQIFDKVASDRYKLLDKTKSCLEMIIGLFTDKQSKAAEIISRYLKTKPILDFTHEEDIRHRIWRIDNKTDIEVLRSVLGESKVIIADGHHRYTTALKYYMESNDARFEYIMMLLWSMNDDFEVLPTHRILRINKDLIREKLTGFEFIEVNQGLDGLLKKMSSMVDKHVFGLYDGRYYLLKPSGDNIVNKVFNQSRSMQWNMLDSNLLSTLVLEPLLGEDTNEAVNQGILKFIKNPAEGVKNVDNGRYDALFLLNPTRIDQIKAIVEAGERMPQKSTYFYPKPLSGILICRL